MDAEAMHIVSPHWQHKETAGPGAKSSRYGEGRAGGGTGSTKRRRTGSASSSKRDVFEMRSRAVDAA